MPFCCYKVEFFLGSRWDYCFLITGFPSQFMLQSTCQEKLNCSFMAFAHIWSSRGQWIHYEEKQNCFTVGRWLFSFLTIALSSCSLSEMAIVGHVQSKLHICVVTVMIFLNFYLMVSIYALLDELCVSFV